MNSPTRWGPLNIHIPSGEGPNTPDAAKLRRWRELARDEKQLSRVPVDRSVPPVRQQPKGDTPSDPDALTDAKHGRTSSPTVRPARDSVGRGGSDLNAIPDFLADSTLEHFIEWRAHSGNQGAAAEIANEPHLPTGKDVLDYLSYMVNEFCNNEAVLDGGEWRISIPLSNRILPATTLHLTLSSNWLILRFQCDDASAKRLISAHRKHLGKTLEAAVAPRREVSIEVD